MVQTTLHRFSAFETAKLSGDVGLRYNAQQTYVNRLRHVAHEKGMSAKLARALQKAYHDLSLISHAVGESRIASGHIKKSQDYRVLSQELDQMDIIQSQSDVGESDKVKLCSHHKAVSSLLGRLQP